MPYLRYRYWNQDGLPARRAGVGNREYIFDDAQDGVCHIPNAHDAMALLRNSNNYEIAWERYGVTFDEEGREVEMVPVAPPEEPEVAASPKRGRPRKA